MDKQQQQQQYKRVFKHLDKNGDGKLSAPELQVCMGVEEAEMAAELLGSGGDGALRLEDLVKVVESANEEERVNELKMAFKMYEEREGCGCITPKSLKRMLSRLGESRSVDDCHLMIAKFDLDGDGVVDFDEFRHMMMISCS